MFKENLANSFPNFLHLTEPSDHSPSCPLLYWRDEVPRETQLMKVCDDETVY